MITSQPTSFLSEILDGKQIPPNRLGYFRGRLSNRLHELVLKVFMKSEAEGKISRAELARRIGRKPEQISRWLGAAGNWTLDTASDLLLGMGCELSLAAVPLGHGYLAADHSTVTQLVTNVVLGNTGNIPGTQNLANVASGTSFESANWMGVGNTMPVPLNWIAWRDTSVPPFNFYSGWSRTPSAISVTTPQRIYQSAGLPQQQAAIRVDIENIIPLRQRDYTYRGAATGGALAALIPLEQATL